MSWSARVVLGGVLAVGLVACEAPTPSGQCGGFVCGGEERCDRETLTCVPDQAPVVTLVVPTGVVTSETFAVTGTVADDVQVKSVTWSFADGAVQPVELGDDGAFSLSVAAPLVDEQPFNVVVTAYDGARSGETLAAVRIDRVGPSVELLAPLPTSTVGGPTAELTLRASDASGALSRLVVGGTEVTSPAEGQLLTTEVPVPAGLDGAAFLVGAEAIDAHGNRTVHELRLLGDRVGPALVIATPTPNAFVTAATASVTGTVTDPTSPLHVRLVLPDGGLTDATMTADGGAWSATFDVPLLESTEVLRVVAEDGVGNVSTANQPVRVDRIAPGVTLTSPTSDSLHSQAFAAAVNTTGGVARVTARLGTSSPVMLAGTSGSWAGQVPVPAQDYGPLTLEATAIDEAGNSTTVQRQVFVDTVAPTVAFVAPTNGRKFNVADFASTNSVTVSWQVQDADPQAATTEVNGSPSAATQLVVPTSASDNGRAVTVSVRTTDRAGHVATGSLTFSIDRVPPTVTNWTPDGGSRNVESRTTSLSFSEPVFGATTSTDAVVLSPGASGTWNTAHDTWTSASLAPYTAYDATLSPLSDSHGNPLVGGARRFHTAAFAATTAPSAPLATGVSSFQVAADLDGVVTVAYRTTAAPNVEQQTFVVRPLSPQDMSLGAPFASSTNDVTSFGVNAWSRANGTTLLARNVSAFSWSVPAPPGDPVLFRRRVEGGVTTSAPAATGAGAALSLFAHPREPDQSDFGFTAGWTYTRGSHSVALSSPLMHWVAQSHDGWVADATSVGFKRWLRYRCSEYDAPTPGTIACEVFQIGLSSAESGATKSSAMNSAGTCFVASWDAVGRGAVFAPLANCDGTQYSNCPLSQTVAAETVLDGFSVAPYTTASRSTLLAAWKTYSDTLQLATMNDPAACTNAFTEIGAPMPATGVISFAPVQIGQKAALFYLDSSNALRVYVP